MTPLSLDKRRVIGIMKSLGWEAKPLPKGYWEFRRPDTAGYWDVFKVHKSRLNWALVMRHDEDFQKIVHDLWEDTAPLRYPKVFAEITE